MTKRWFPAIILCTLALSAQRGYACRYNVREVGFIDVGIDSYYLFGCVPADHSPEARAELKEQMDAVLSDTNVRFEVVSLDAGAEHPALKCLASHGIEARPAAVLLSPDGQSRPIALPAAGSFGGALALAAADILISPTRQAILRKCAESYGVVLMVEGPSPQENAVARDAAVTAIGYVKEQLGYLPKPIATAPELVVLDHQSLAPEATLLWTLGLAPEDVNRPHMAIFYGRGRWIGPLFADDMISDRHLTELLLVVGADCECGLDHRWLQGTMLPARWGEDLQASVAKGLGFDPENPMIKMEMVSIVRRGMGGFDYPGVPFGYQEVQVGGEMSEADLSDGDLAVAEPPQPEGPEEASPVIASQPEPAQETAEPEERGMELKIIAASLGGMTVLVALVSVIVVLRAKKA